MKVGDRVKAMTEIAEDNFNGKKKWIHAKAGDRGKVVYISDTGCATVQFDKTGTATVVAPTEIKLITKD